MKSDVLALIKRAPDTQDAQGFPVAGAETSRVVFGTIRSVGSSEFYVASQVGYKATLKIDVNGDEYDGEELAEYPVGSGQRYKVIRTYMTGEKIELTIGDYSGSPGVHYGKP